MRSLKYVGENHLISDEKRPQARSELLMNPGRKERAQMTPSARDVHNQLRLRCLGSGGDSHGSQRELVSSA